MLKGKQKCYLRGLANTMPSFFQVGKDGLSQTVYDTVRKALIANELIKLNVLKTCEVEVDEVAKELAKATRSEIVQIIGRTIVLYKPAKEPKIVPPK